MLETKAQTIKALKEISKKTGWSQREIAAKAGVNHATISRLMAKQPKDAPVRTPTQETREGIWNVLLMARGLK